MSNPAADVRALIAEAEALADAATPGEWRAERRNPFTMDILLIDDDPNTLAYGLIASDLVPADAELCAASRTLVPQLAAALRQCVEALEAIEGADDLDTAIGTAHTALSRAAAAMEGGDA